MIAQALQLPNGDTIPYQLALRARRTVGLKITAHGLEVHAPKRITQPQLQQILLRKADWIREKLRIREAQQVPAMAWQEGESLLFMGQDIVLSLTDHPTSLPVELLGNQLCVRSPHIANADWVAKQVKQWYAKQALVDFSRRVQLVAAQMQASVHKVALSNAKTRWGSCNSRREIRLNWRLIQAPPQMIQYVVCHEMAHLKEMNHSPRFYAVLSQLFPAHAQVEKEIKAWSSILYRMA